MATRRVILVEDDPDDRDLFVDFYSKREDISLLPAVNDGVELVNYLTNVAYQEELPHLIILDQNMPRMNGTQTLSFLKSHELYSNIPAVIYSTYTDSNLIIECKKLGAVMVASKPIDNEGYQKMMDDFLLVL